MSPGTINILTNLGIIAGLLMLFGAHLFRSPDAPRRYIWRPRSWRPIWRLKGDFRKPGFELLIGGNLIFVVAFVVRIAVLGWPCW